MIGQISLKYQTAFWGVFDHGEPDGASILQAMEQRISMEISFFHNSSWLSQSIERDESYNKEGDR